MTKLIFQSKPTFWRSLISIYTSSPENMIDHDLSEKLRADGYSQEQIVIAVPIIKNLFERQLCNAEVLSENAQSEYFNSAFLTKSDLEYLKSHITKDTPTNLARLVTALAVYARKNHHPSHWIKLDKNEVFFMAGIHKLPAKDIRALTNQAHLLYNLEMQVVGSKKPIPCFRFAWQSDDPDNEKNPLIDVSDYSPKGIDNLVKTLLN